MNTAELAQKLHLHPRAVVMSGTITLRMKNQGALPGLTPHYARPGCPVVSYAGANAVEEPSAAEIEFSFQESGFPLPSAMGAYSPKQGNLVQLMYGRNGAAPTQGAYRVLREASTVLSQVAEAKREVYLATLPILTPGQMGVTSGRHYLLGAFNGDGVALYLNPDAIEHQVLKAEFPAHQKERSTGGVSREPEASASWYEALASAMATATGLKGDKLYEVVLRARAQQLVDQGRAPDLKAGLAQAAQEAPKGAAQGKTAPTAAAPARESSTRQIGARMRGRTLQDLARDTAGTMKGPAKAPARGRGR